MFHYLGEDILQHTKAQLARQHFQSRRAKDLLNALEERSRYFQFGKDVPKVEDDNKQTDCAKTDTWFRPDDLKNADQMNEVGPNGRNYNWDKYGKKPPQHTYSLIGNVFSTGMDFSGKETLNIPKEAYIRPSHARRRRGPTESGVAVQPRHGSAPPTAMDLPANIRHKFGTTVCNVVLSDKQKVQQTLDQQRKRRDQMHKTRKQNPSTEMPPDDADPQYEALGLALRQNVFPGFTYDHKSSTSKDVYTNDVYDNRQTDPDEYRYQRDELSKYIIWNNVHYQRIYFKDK